MTESVPTRSTHIIPAISVVMFQSLPHAKHDVVMSGDIPSGVMSLRHPIGNSREFV